MELFWFFPEFNHKKIKPISSEKISRIIYDKNSGTDIIFKFKKLVANIKINNN